MTIGRWLDVTGERSRLLFFVGASVAAVCAYRLRPTADFWIPVALAGVALAIWHGAYDGVLAERAFGSRYSHHWRLPFYLTYLLLAAFVLLLWWVVPVAALAGFLLYSAFHFGAEAERRRTWSALAGAAASGAVPIAAACRWSPREVVAIFTTMLRGRGSSAATADHIGAMLLVPVVLIAVALAYTQPRLFGMRLGLIGAQLLLFRFCSPVLAFAVYFCLWHTPEHLVETSRDYRDHFSLALMRNNLRRGFTPWLLSMAAIALAFVYGRHGLVAYTGLIFITLSALTVPHMILGLVLSTMQINVGSGPAGNMCGVAR